MYSGLAEVGNVSEFLIPDTGPVSVRYIAGIYEHLGLKLASQPALEISIRTNRNTSPVVRPFERGKCI